ncbi:hypothetical protein LY90DRAFT_291976 [Neocallimastix californiae]|uniref:Uncharacterized protein n=1 Tax=Neocallimastix californiae TaxID=1754190 RepID=A0A1Y2CVY9_9FUNG|nr:hypothetical protein LY90DRAFT_291976 [Neocallimastix californiae]|eukprot:ORY51200.1 hypothetical protein LY90DRAFT_291976 [Neocallimastix californiae]
MNRNNLDLLGGIESSVENCSSNEMNRKRTVSVDTLNDVQMSERSDEDNSIKQEIRHINKRKRQLGNNLTEINSKSTEIMEHGRSSLKMKQQNKQSTQTPISSTASSRTTSPPETRLGRKRSVNSPKYRNAKNLTISTTNMDNIRNSPRPISAPINPASNKLAPFHPMNSVDHGTTILQGNM